MPFMQMRAWYYKRVFALQVRYYLPDYTESTNGIVWQCQLCKSSITLGVTQIAYLALSGNANCALQVRYYLPDYTESTIGIVWQCQLCTPGLVLPARLHRIHNWHCLTMPIVQVGDNPWCYTDSIFGIVWQIGKNQGLWFPWSKSRPLIGLQHEIQPSHWLKYIAGTHQRGVPSYIIGA